MTEAMTAEMRSGKSSPKKKWWDVSVSVAEIRKEYGEALSSAYQSVWDGLGQVERVDDWWGWLMGRREEERMTLSQEVEALLSQCNADGSPNYDAIVAMQAEVLAYDRAPIWKQAWQTAQGRGVERKRATLLGCQVKIHQLKASKSYKQFEYHTSRMEGIHMDFDGGWSAPSSKDDPFVREDWSFKDQLGKLSWVYSAAKSAFTGFYDFICGGLPGHKPRKGINAGHIAEALDAAERRVKHERQYGPEKSMREVVRESAHQIVAAFATMLEERRAAREAIIHALTAREAALKPVRDLMTSRLDEAVAFCQSLPGSTFVLTESRQALLDDLKQRIARAYNEQELAEIYESEPYQSVMKDWVPAEAAHILEGRLQDLTAARGGPARGFADTDVMRRAMGLAEGAAAASEDSVPSAVM